MQTGIDSIKPAPWVGSPAADVLRTPQQQPSLTPQQQAKQKAQAMVALHQQRQASAAAPTTAVASDLLPGQPVRVQSRLAAPANLPMMGMFMPVSSNKARNAEQRPVRHVAEHGNVSDILVGVPDQRPVPSAQPHDLVKQTQPPQTYSLIETDIL